MTDNPTLSPQRQPEDHDAALRQRGAGLAEGAEGQQRKERGTHGELSAAAGSLWR